MNRFYTLLWILSSLYSSGQTNSVFSPKEAADLQQKPSIYSSSIQTIFLKNPIAPPTATQAKDRLLWYKGKKADDSTLITTDATLIRWSKWRDIVIVQPKKDPFIKMAAELGNTQKRKDQVYKKMAERKTSVMFYPVIAATFNELDDLVKKYGNAMKNTIDLPPALQTIGYNPSKIRKGGTASLNFNSPAGIPEYIKKTFQGVMASMKNYPPIDFPAPPATDFGYCLNYCDSSARKTKDSLEVAWQEAFTKYEGGIVKTSLSIIKSIELLKLSGDPEAEVIVTGLNKAMEFADARIKNKVDLLIRKYSKDFTRVPTVVRVAISYQRQKQLLGIDNVENNSNITTLSSYFDGFDKFIEQRMDAKDYNVAFNFPLIISMERQRQLLGGDEYDDRIDSQINKFFAYNRFKIDIQLDFSSIDESECGISTDRVSAKTEIPHYVAIVPLNCKFVFIQHEQHMAEAPLHLFGVGSIVNLKTGAGTKIEKQTDPDDADKCITVKTPYSNLPLRIGLPYAKMTFCGKPDSDTLFVSQLEMDGVKDKKGPSKIYGYYGNEWNTDEEPEDNTYEAEEDDIKKIMEEYVFKKSKSSQALSLEETHKYQQAIERMDVIKLAQKQKKKVPDPFFTFKAQNGNSTLIEGGRIIIAKDEVYEDQYGYERKLTTNFKVKVVHDPLPHKK